MASQPGQKWESAGWGVFAILFIVGVGPCIYFALQWRVPGSPTLAPYAGGVIVAGVAAAILTVMLNSILQSRAANRQAGNESGAGTQSANDKK